MKHMMIKVLSLVMALTMIMGMFGAVAVSAAGHTHTKGEKVKTVAPTCVAYGYTLYECAGCGEQYADDVLPKTEECQNIEDVPAVEATCTTDAITAGKKCKDCDKYVEGGDPVPNTALGHNYDIMLIQPTCTEEGAVIEACTRCYDATKKWYNQDKDVVKDNKNLMLDENGNNKLPALNNTAHTFVYFIAEAPTCTDAGKATYKCKDCNEVTVENIYVAPSEALHNWVDVKDEETCLKPGLDGKECTECWTYLPNKDENGDGVRDIKDVVAPKNHKNKLALDLGRDILWMVNVMGFENVADGKKDPTCTEAGFEWFYCPDCKEYVKEDKAALGHTLPNTADEKLMKKVIEAVKNQPVGKLVSATDEKGKAYKFYIVSVANCEQGTVISCERIANCDETMTLDNATSADHTHVWTPTPADPSKSTTGWTVKDPTCTTAGWTMVKCTKCDVEDRRDIKPALGHNYKYSGTDCTVGITVTCKRNCGYTETLKYADHKTAVTTVPATCNEYAYDINACTVPNCTHKTIVDANKDGKPDYRVSEGFNPNNHSAKIMVEGAYYIPATCVTTGLATYACKNCAATSWTEELPKITDPKHNWIAIEAIAPTCQETGRTAGYVCLTCAADADLMKQLEAKNAEAKALGKEEPYKYNDGSVELEGKNAKGENAKTEGKAYVWVSGGMKVAKDATAHVVKTTKFHRVGTCTMPELYLYECVCGATWSKQCEKDTKNHNTYVYNAKNQVITASSTFVDGTVVRNNNGTPNDATDDFDEVVIPAAVAGKHWGALLTYVEGKDATCTAAGNHNYVKCTGCSEVVAVSGYKIDFNATNGTFETTTKWDCSLCENYVADQIKANDKSADTKATGVVPCPGMTLVLKNKGKDDCAIDTGANKTTWNIEIAATGHKEVVVKETQETCTTVGYTAGVRCDNAHCDLKLSEVEADGKQYRYISGHVLIPAHNGRYMTSYNEENGADLTRAETCTEYGIKGDVKYCAICESRITDITKKTWYVAPLGHLPAELKGEAVANNCEEVGFKVYKCARNCSNESIWTDLNNDGLVNVVTKDNGLKETDSEYTWFVTDYTLATGHKWPEYNLEKKTGYNVGVYYNGEIFEIGEFTTKYMNPKAYDLNGDGIVDASCLFDLVKYIKCACGLEKAVDEVIPAAGHIYVNGEIKTPISTNCNEIKNYHAFNCTYCGLTNINDTKTTHDLVVVSTPTTCTKPGQYYWACKDCDKAFYATDRTDATPVYEIYNPQEIDWDAVAKEVEAGNTTNHERIEKTCKAKFAKIDEYVKATATEDGYFKYTCQTCLETVTVVLPAGEEVLLTFNSADVLGSEVTANGNEVVISIAYTAKSFKFRTFNLGVWFDDAALTFNKAEVKATFAEELAVTTDVAVDEDYIDILTAVNVAKAEAELIGEDVAYVDLYFTVNDTTSYGIIEDYIGAYIEALVYNEAGKLVTVDIYSGIFDADLEEDVLAGYTGDVDGDDVINTADLVALMDMIYTADAKYVAAADINKDGKVDVDDYAALRTFTASKQCADDYAAMMGVELPEIDYATMIVDTLRVQKIDLNKDGIVNALDYQHLVANSNSYAAGMLYNLYNLDWADADWDNFFYSTYTVEDITDLVLDAYAAML